MPTYLSERLKLDATHGLLLIIAVIIAVGGRMSDRFGRKPVMMAGCLGFLALSHPLMLLVHDGGVLPTLEVSMPATLPALFPTAIRYGALSIAFNVSVSLFGGTTPLVMQSLISVTGNDYWPAWYVMAAAATAVGLRPAVDTEEEAHAMVRESRQN